MCVAACVWYLCSFRGPLPEEVDPTVIGACLFYQVNCEYERFESMKANIVHLAKTSIEVSTCCVWCPCCDNHSQVCAVIMDCCVRQLAFKSSPHISMLISVSRGHSSNLLQPTVLSVH